MNLPFKHARLNGTDEIATYVGAHHKDNVLGCCHGSLCIPPSVEDHKLCAGANISFDSEEDVQTSTIFPTVTRNLHEDESSQESNLDSPSFDRHPRKLVPIGRQYQADLPEWRPRIVSQQSDKKAFSLIDLGTSVVDSEEGDVGKFMGTCVIEMPDKAFLQCWVQRGCMSCDCSCFDSGSAQCVKQHVEEARESLLNSLGRERYVDLGFLEMGVEVAHGWSDEEQQIFDEVVYMNPMSQGKNFWHCFSEKLTSRSQRDLVSYYYNVFMLRIRATQNRCQELEIDSDDDEWHGEAPYSADVHDDEGEGSQLEPATDLDNENYSADDDHNKDSGIDFQFVQKDTNFISGYKLCCRGSSGCVEISDAPGSDYTSYMNFPYYSSESESGSNHSEVSSRTCYHTEGSVSDFNFGLGLYDSHESLVWGSDTFTSCFELLPTSNMIEEIFGPGSCNKKSTDVENSQ